jgi:hypothetical protein
MEEKDLLVVIGKRIKNYQANLNRIKKDLHQRGAHGGSVSYYPIRQRKEMSWVLDSLEKMGCDTAQFEKTLLKIDEEFKTYENSHKEELLDQLYNDLRIILGPMINLFQYIKSIFLIGMMGFTLLMGMNLI